MLVWWNSEQQLLSPMLSLFHWKCTIECCVLFTKSFVLVTLKICLFIDFLSIRNGKAYLQKSWSLSICWVASKIVYISKHYVCMGTSRMMWRYCKTSTPSRTGCSYLFSNIILIFFIVCCCISRKANCSLNKQSPNSNFSIMSLCVVCSWVNYGILSSINQTAKSYVIPQYYGYYRLKAADFNEGLLDNSSYKIISHAYEVWHDWVSKVIVSWWLLIN